MPQLLKKYREEIVPALKEKRGYANIMQIPKLEKIVISTGIGSSAERDAFTEAKNHIAKITGQTPVITKSKKNVSNFKLRVGMPVGVIVTLRGSKMYEFLFRLINTALPRVRDFRGVSSKGFDGAGNYNMGVQDISVFTEIDLDKLKYQMGFNVAFVTSAKSDDEALDLLTMLGIPFAS